MHNRRAANILQLNRDEFRAERGPMQPGGVLETCLYVDDLEEAERFYRAVLGLRVVGRKRGRHVFFRCGRQMLLLFNAAVTSHSDGVPAHGAAGSSHVAFSISARQLRAWRSRLESQGVVIERAVDWPQGGHSLYFRDPAGNSLELATPSIWEQARATPEPRPE